MAALDYSIFKQVFFPPEVNLDSQKSQDLKLRRATRFRLEDDSDFRKYPFVVFDFETTGLDANHDHIIEIGALKIVNFEVVDEFSTLVSTDIPLSDMVQRLTGIRPEMLVGKPSIEDVWAKFLNFFEGSILIAHNASFDYSFLKAESLRQGIEIEWPTFCTLKMAREYLSQLERKTLDSLAQHYGLEFEARHRSIGDVKVTISVLQELLSNEGAHLQMWADMMPFRVS